MNIYWGMSKEGVEAAHKEGKRIASKYFTEGDGGWAEDESPSFNWTEFDYTVIVEAGEKLPIIDVETNNGPFLGKGEIKFSFTEGDA